ncbi:hypothetical protein QTP86_013436, partial [Hemibagrus guttatus]
MMLCGFEIGSEVVGIVYIASLIKDKCVIAGQWWLKWLRLWVVDRQIGALDYWSEGSYLRLFLMARLVFVEWQRDGLPKPHVKVPLGVRIFFVALGCMEPERSFNHIFSADNDMLDVADISMGSALTHQGMDSTRSLKVCCGIWHQDVSSRSFKS